MYRCRRSIGRRYQEGPRMHKHTPGARREHEIFVQELDSQMLRMKMLRTPMRHYSICEAAACAKLRIEDLSKSIASVYCFT